MVRRLTSPLAPCGTYVQEPWAFLDRIERDTVNGDFESLTPKAFGISPIKRR